MEKLLAYFPVSSNVQAKDTKSLIVSIVLYLAACLVMGIVQGILGGLPVIGWVLSILGAVVELYSVIGIVLSVMKFLEVK